MTTPNEQPHTASAATVALLPHFAPHVDGLQTIGGRIISLSAEDRALAARCTEEQLLPSLGTASPETSAALDRLLAAGYLVRLPPPLVDRPARPRDLVLSPHIDDAALSLGGFMAARRGTVAAPLVINIFSVQSYQSGLRAPAHRLAELARAEDRLAARILGYECRWLGLHGAQDRHRLSLSGVMGWDASVVAANPRLQRDVDDVIGLVVAATAAAGSESFARLFAPAAIGGHLDHVIAALAAPQIAKRLGIPPHRVVLYEDLPYAAADLGGGVGLHARAPRLESFAAVTSDKRAALAVFKSRLRGPQIELCIAHARRLTDDENGAAERLYVCRE